MESEEEGCDKHTLGRFRRGFGQQKMQPSDPKIVRRDRRDRPLVHYERDPDGAIQGQTGATRLGKKRTMSQRAKGEWEQCATKHMAGKGPRTKITWLSYGH